MNVSIESPTEHQSLREFHEGPIARTIETQTAKLPSDTFLWAALGAISASLCLKIIGRDHAALFVGQWAPTLLILGLYNKVVKQHGSDERETQARETPLHPAGHQPRDQRSDTFEPGVEG